MKKLALLLLCIWVGLAGAMTMDMEAQGMNQAFRITGRTANTMNISFSPGSFRIEEERVGDTVYQHIVMPGASSTIDEGMPELPLIGASVIVPAHGTVSVRSNATNPRSLGVFKPYPVQQRMDLESPKSFLYNDEFFSGNSTYPAVTTSYSEPAILRDFRFVSLQVSPFFYDAGTGELSVYDNLELELEFGNGPGLNELAEEPSYVSPYFDKLYSATFLNYDDYRWMVPVSVPPRYLVIHGNSSDPNFVQAISNFVLWKRQKGADVRVASTTVTGTSNTAIKAYIQNLYNDLSTRPDYIIFIGDTTGSFPIPTYNENSGPGDYPYTRLDGTDGVGDVYIGRISVENVAQLLVVMNKAYTYERDIDISTASWLNKMLLAADWAPSGISTVYMSKYLKETSKVINPDYTYTEIYGDSSLGTQIVAGINQGVGFYNFRGYIDLAGWTPGTTYYNGYKTPHTWMLTCGTGNFDSSSPSKTEDFYRLGTAVTPSGGLTATGMATSSTHTTFNNALNGGLIHGVTQAGMRTMGEALLAGKVNIYRIFSVSAPTEAAKFAQWCNLIGDPTMEIFMGIPQQFNVAVEDTIALGTSLLDVAVTDNNGLAVESVAVTLSQGDQVISRGYTDAEGNVILVLPGGMTVGNAVITVSAHEFKPSQITIAVSDLAYLVPGTVVIDDDNTGASQGNTNALANPGETIEINFGLQNTGTSLMPAVSGYATSLSPYVTMIDSLVTYGDIAGGNLGFSLEPIVFSVAPNAPFGTTLRFHLYLSDGSQMDYSVSEFVPVEAARFSFNTAGVLDGGNNALDPGETTPFTIGINNIGPMEVADLYGRLYTLNDLVVINDNIGFFGTVPVDGTATAGTDNFSISAREMILPGMVIPMRVKLYNAAGFEQYLDFSLTIGTVNVQDPLGPCSYGYMIFDDGDWSYAEAPTFQWVGIAPAEGGLGTILPLSDAYTSGDEGDQVGGTAITTIALPFPFQFYGIQYTQASISSNGFLVLGESANAEFRNFRLPGPMGGSPMIAPFWDDLATHSGGGVYTWYDRSNNAFVVEWYNMKNGKNGTSLETFQAILYDQAYHPTSFGDGPIKFQYQTFNNVDSQSGANHGSYCSIGIEDHTGTRGLEYSFNNVYPVAASPLGNQRALYITTVPVYHMEASLILDQTYVDDNLGNSNGIAEPGETIRLGLQLTNIGNAPASGITALLTSSDPMVNITTAEAEYYPLEAEQSGVNREAFVVEISPVCPDGQVLSFTLTVTSGDDEWIRNFSIRVEASMLNLNSYMIDDSESTFNGSIDQGETVKLIVNIGNQTSVEATSVVGTLTTSRPNTTISNPVLNRAAIDANTIMQFVYDITVTGEENLGEEIPFTFSASSGNAEALEADFFVPYGVSGESNSFEHNNGEFISEGGWTWGDPSQVTPYSGSMLWGTNLSGYYPENITYSLLSPAYLLNDNSNMSFRHFFNSEAGYDGGNVSVSTDAGANWTILTPAGGYTHNNVNSLGNQPGFSGNSNGWEEEIFNLNPYAGQNVIFKFKFCSDGSNNGQGWFIDNFSISNVDKRVAKLHGFVIPTSGYSPELAVVKASNQFATHPALDGSYALYLKRGSYTAEGKMRNHQSSNFGPFTLDSANMARYTEFTLIYLPKPFSIAFTFNNDTRDLNISWTEPYDPVLPAVAYRVYKRFDMGAFQFVTETTEQTYTENLPLDGAYQYYVRVRYINVEGSPSDTLSFSVPYVAGGDAQNPALITRLNSNYPNPFNPTTTISFDLAESGRARLSVYNLRGQLVRTLFNGEKESGRHSIVWDGRDDTNRSVSSGVYFYRLETPKHTSTRKMLMVK